MTAEFEDVDAGKENTDSFIQMFSGRKFDFLNPDPDSIRLVDIAHSLAHIVRFNGHINKFYSVADHSLNVLQHLERKQANRATLQHALLHDAAECFIGDIVSPLKKQLPLVIDLEARLQVMIRKQFGIDDSQVDFTAVKRADEAILVVEAKTLFDFAPLENWTDRFNAEPVVDPLHISDTPAEAELLFLLIANQLFR